MTLQQQLVHLLERHNLMAGGQPAPLFRLASPCILDQRLGEGSPYLSGDPEGGASPAYVDRCREIAEKLYGKLSFGKQVLVVYEDIYGENKPAEVAFLESCLPGCRKAEITEFQWTDAMPPGNLPSITEAEEYTYTCIRRLYEPETMDIPRLFREVILSDIGGRYDFASRLYLIDIDSACIFHLYDDRGLSIYSPREISLSVISAEHDDIPEGFPVFSIRTGPFYWQDGSLDDPEDLCLHGLVSVRIGPERLAYPCTVSAAALRLLRTLTENHIPANCGEQMLPCCGHSLIADEALDNVTIIGCDNGADWMVRHEDGGIRLTTAAGRQTLADAALYREEVCKFADAVEAFYQNCSPKRIPEKNQFDKAGYTAFWNEWRRRRGS